MGRNRRISDEQFNEKSMKAFWFEGCDTLSTRGLKEILGLHTGSLYHRFGSVEDIFAKSIDYYVSSIIETRIKNYLSEPSRENLEKFLWTAVEPLVNGESSSCLLLHASLSIRGRSKKPSEAVKKGFLTLESAFQNAIRAMYSNENQATIKAKARHILVFYQGLLSVALIKPDADFLKNTIQTQLELILN